MLNNIPRLFCIQGKRDITLNPFFLVYYFPRSCHFTPWSYTRGWILEKPRKHSRCSEKAIHFGQKYHVTFWTKSGQIINKSTFCPNAAFKSKMFIHNYDLVRITWTHSFHHDSLIPKFRGSHWLLRHCSLTYDDF